MQAEQPLLEAKLTVRKQGSRAAVVKPAAAEGERTAGDVHGVRSCWTMMLVSERAEVGSFGERAAAVEHLGRARAAPVVGEVTVERQRVLLLIVAAFAVMPAPAPGGRRCWISVRPGAT